MESIRLVLVDYLGIVVSGSLRNRFFRPPIGFQGVLSFRSHIEYVLENGVLPHPFMSLHTTNMHENGSATDVTGQAGPTARSRLIDQTYLTYIDEEGSGRLGMLPTLGYRSDGKIVAIGAKASSSTEIAVTEIKINGWKEYSVLLINPDTLQIEQSVPLPRQEANTSSISTVAAVLTGTLSAFYQIADAIWGWDEHKLYEDSSGGAYFTLDNQDRAIIPIAGHEIWIVRFRTSTSPEITIIPIPDLSSTDGLHSVSLCWMYEDHYWFTTREGIIGVVTITGDVVNRYNIRLSSGGAIDEKINNSIAVCADGMFVVSSYALYRFDYRPDIDNRFFIWRTEYDRGTVRKCGQLPPPGSGTTPTLLGERFVAICDNSWNMNAHVFDRLTGRTTSVTRIFQTPAEGGNTPDGETACDNSIVAFKFKLFIGNTYCYRDPFSPNPTGGLSRIDINPINGSATRNWTRPDITIWSAVPKYSTQTNLLYIYARENINDDEWWHVKGIDDQGVIQVSIPIHEQEMVNGIEIGLIFRREKVDRYDNGWGPMYIGLDTWGQPSIMLGMTQGLYRLRFSGA
ncbi:hypothetical protein CSC80_10660 [Maribacter sp. 6B07]|uniref:hypothetical protein n=1 Tax=Maribacter sp. 6B07 TaxID=2045442 RepID=UPI000C08D5EC|nr:hypothetical protein [Maribacter sp. 6B07]PHN93382.1 hypothetical protein CSC80_10660 [Maribacter sp. 6B07]|tara:strand:+ start:19523 stop:21229 length:1707 start_codon:yes stop_codon:yes gene_type:complete